MRVQTTDTVIARKGGDQIKGINRDREDKIVKSG
jgi:hypothetical protein